MVSEPAPCRPTSRNHPGGDQQDAERGRRFVHFTPLPSTQRHFFQAPISLSIDSQGVSGEHRIHRVKDEPPRGAEDIQRVLHVAIDRLVSRRCSM